MKINKRLQWVLNGLTSRNIDFSSACEYGEPGYTADKPIILFANWNQLNKSEMSAVESVSEIEWSDEWVQDSNGVKAYRSQPDSHGWAPAWFEHDGEVVPYESLPHDGEDLRCALEEYGFIHDQSCRVGLKGVPPCISAERLATFATLINGECQTGFHPGQNDTPASILAAMPAGSYLFQVTSTGQFDVNWSVWKVNAEIKD